MLPTLRLRRSYRTGQQSQEQFIIPALIKFQSMTYLSRICPAYQASKAGPCSDNNCAIAPASIKHASRLQSV